MDWPENKGIVATSCSSGILDYSSYQKVRSFLPPQPTLEDIFTTPNQGSDKTYRIPEKLLRSHKIKWYSIRDSRREAFFAPLINRVSDWYIKFGALLAGGALRGLYGHDIVDYDIFLPRIEDVNEKKSRIDSIKGDLIEMGFFLSYTSPKKILFNFTNSSGIKIQIIDGHRIWDRESPEELLKGFDIGACTAAFDGKYLIYLRAFLHDNITYKLSLVNVQFPVKTLMRINRYFNKGFSTDLISHQFIQFLSDHQSLLGEQQIYIDSY